MKKRVTVPKGQISMKFLGLMRRQAHHAYYRYGPTVENAKTVDFAKEARHRISMYFTTGNTEYLVDVATFCMAEFMYPHRKGAVYKPDPRSLGLVSGKGSREVEEELRQTYKHEGD